MFLRLLLPCSLLACASAPSSSEPLPVERAQARRAQAERAQVELVEAAPALSQVPVMLVEDPEALALIAERVADFGTLALGARARGLSNAQLASEPSYRALIAPIERDLRALTASDPQAGVSVRGHAHRTFDLRWLSAASARFELVAVANRMDRRALDQQGCGETRLIYRLAYDQGEASRLPFTIAIELRAEPDGECKLAAQRWLKPPLQGRALAERLVADDGPLAPARVTRERMVQLAINVQAVRWPSAVRPDLGGHAEYLLRAFHWDGTRYLARPLENTPDVSRLARDPALKEELARWLRAHAREIDGAYAQIPERFLAEVTTSVTPRGFNRLANRPFARLFAPSAFAALPFADLKYARTAEAFVRRLDDLSCVGCHQARSVAGFHQLGADAPMPYANALAISHSPHVHDDLARRRAYVEALAQGRAPDDARPFAERSSEHGGYGAHCGLGDPSFAGWTCDQGLHCDAFEGDSVGTCLGALATGDPCEPARIVPNADAHRDGARRGESRSCPEICEATRVGFPSGMCAGSCGRPDANSTCGAIAILTPFNDCLARGRPFAECASVHVRPAGLRACDADHPCRDDYLCARTSSGNGACLPPYFVFQMRVDGHPAPR